MTHREKVSYCAGFIDGEGTIYITRNSWRINNMGKTGSKSFSYEAKISVKQVKPEPLQLCKKLFGGSLWQEPKNYGHFTDKKMWVWTIQNRQCEMALRELTPFLIEKKRQAEICLKLRRHIDKHRNRRKRFTSFIPIMKIREKMYWQCKSMNHWDAPLEEIMK